MEELLKKIKKIVDSGTPPTKQRMRGDPPPKESPVAKKRRLENILSVKGILHQLNNPIYFQVGLALIYLLIKNL